MSNLPVWYIQAGEMENGTFACKSQGSGVLVYLKKAGERPFKALVTAQHVLRSGTDQTSGKYYSEYRAWPPQVGYNPGTCVEFEVLVEVSPQDSVAFEDSEDYAILKPKNTKPGALAAKILDGASCKAILPGLIVSGYPDGEVHIQNNAYIVDPSEHPEWRYTRLDPRWALGILAPGDAPPQTGVSGGGVFLKDYYAGVYRGQFKTVKDHLFLPIPYLRQHCGSLDYSLINVDQDGVNNTNGKETARTIEALKEAMAIDPKGTTELLRNLIASQNGNP